MAVVKSPRIATGHNRRPLKVKVAKKRRETVTLARSLTTAPIVVIVGKKSEMFYIHESFLCATSAFFKNHIKPEWSSRDEKLINLPAINPVVFNIYTHWLYQDYIGITKEKGTVKPDSGVPKSPEIEWTKWNECYEFGFFIQDIDFSDALIDFAIDKMSDDEEYIDNLPSMIYSKTTETSPHRKLVVDLAINVWLHSSLKSAPNDGLVAGFVADLGAASLSMLRTGGLKEVGVYDFFKKKDTCIYHEHTSNKSTCYKVKRDLL